jgi:ABC-type uncharacterized transport system permease subunit
MIALGEVNVERSGIGIALAGEVEAGQGAIVGFAIAPRVEIDAGGRLIIGLREAAVAGAIGGLVFGVLMRLLRRR